MSTESTWQQLLFPDSRPPPPTSFIIPALTAATHVTNTKTHPLKNPLDDTCLPAVLLDGHELTGQIISRLKSKLPTSEGPSLRSTFEWESCREELDDLKVRSEGDVTTAANRIIRFAEVIRREIQPNRQCRFSTRAQAASPDGSVVTDALVIDEQAMEDGIEDQFITPPTIAWENKTPSVFEEHVPGILANFPNWTNFEAREVIDGPLSIVVKVSNTFHSKSHKLTVAAWISAHVPQEGEPILGSCL
jgi:hypothetical protein